MPMLLILGWSIVVLLGICMAVNGAFMLASPRAWFRLPHWLGKRGSLTEKKYARGWGAIQVRLAGGMILATITWVVYDSVRGRR